MTDIKTPELLPCPFCPSPDVALKDFTHKTVFSGRGRSWGKCEQCKAEGPKCETPKLAAAAWNTRADGWLPIESAPKDGIWVLIYVPSLMVPNGKNYRRTDPFIGQARWYKYAGDNKMHQLPAHTINLGERFGGLWTTHKNGRKAVIGMPTHWMPLPSCPE